MTQKTTDIDITMNKISHHIIAGKAEFQSFARLNEASRSGERPECKATDNQRHETNAAPSQGSDTNSVKKDTNVGKPGTPQPSTQERQ